MNLTVNLKINQTRLETVSKYKYLGLILNPQLTLTDNINKTIGTVSTKLNTLVNLRKYVYSHTLLTLYKTAILPLMEYGNIVNSLIPLNQRRKLQRIQNRDLKIIYTNLPTTTTEDLHIRAKIAPIAQRSDRQLLCLMYRRAQLPDKYPQIQTNVTTRANERIRFATPRPKTEKYKKYPMYRGSQLWDTLSPETQKLTSYELFKYSIPKTPNFQEYPVTG